MAASSVFTVNSRSEAFFVYAFVPNRESCCCVNPYIQYHGPYSFPFIFQQDEPNPALRLAIRAGKMESCCPLAWEYLARCSPKDKTNTGA